MSDFRKLLEKVNFDVNNSVQYRTDTALYGAADFWVVANGQGDCEDYALAKRKKLLEAGVPLEQLRLACGYTETKEYHAFLIARDPDTGADWVLDNRFPTLMAPNDLLGVGYKFDRAQVAGQDYWEHIEVVEKPQEN